MELGIISAVSLLNAALISCRIKPVFESTDMSKYIIQKTRVSFIQEHFFEWSFGKPKSFQPNRDAFSNLDHPADLHFLAYIYNWDDGSMVLEWLLDSLLCTRSTANLLFWRAAPDWYLKYSLNDIEACPSHARDGLIVLQKIVNKYHANAFSDFQIEFDPTSEIERITTKDPKWTFPPGVYDKIKGVRVVY